MVFNAGAIQGTITLDKNAYDRGLEQAKKDALEFEKRKINVKLNLDREGFKAGLKEANAELDAFRRRKVVASVDLETRAFGRNLEKANAGLDRFRSAKATATVDVNTARAEARLKALELQLARLGGRNVSAGVDAGSTRSIKKAGDTARNAASGFNLLYASIAAIAPVAASATVAVSGLAAGAATAFTSAAIGVGLFGGALKSELSQVTEARKQIYTLNKKIKDSATTNQERAKALQQVNQIMKGLSPTQRKLLKEVDGLSRSWKEFVKNLEPQTFTAISTGIDLAEEALHAFAPAAVGAGNAVDGFLTRIDALYRGGTFNGFIKFVNTEAEPTIDRFGQGLTGFVVGFARVAPQFKPAADMISNGFAGMGRSFAAWAGSQRGQQQIQRFVSYVTKYGPILWYDLKEIGTALGNLFVTLARWGGRGLEGLQTLFQEHPGLAQTVVNVAALGFAFKAFGGKIGLLTKPLKLVVALLGFGGEGAATGLAGLLGAGGPVGIAIGAAVIGIGALAAGMVILYRNSATVRGYVSQLVNGFKTAADLFMRAVKPAFQDIADAIHDNSGEFHWLLVNLKPLITFVSRYAIPALGATWAEELIVLAKAVEGLVRGFGLLIKLFRGGLVQATAVAGTLFRLLQRFATWGTRAFNWIPGASGLLRTIAGLADRVADALHRMNVNANGGKRMSYQLSSSLGRVAGQMGRNLLPTNRLTTGTGKLNAQMKQANKHANTLLASLRKLAGGDLAVLQAQDDYTAAVKRADRALVRSRGNVDGRTAADRRARKALDQEVVSGIDYIRYLKQSGASNNTVRKEIMRQRDQVQKQAGDTKYGRKIINTYNRELDSIPRHKKTNIDVHGNGTFTVSKSVQKAMNTGLKGLLGGIKGGLAGGGVARRALAGGGHVGPDGVVHGPGGDRTDTAGLYTLSNDEFVVNAPASRAFRGQLMAMNDWGNRGTNYRGQYAGGGVATGRRVGHLFSGGTATGETATGDNGTWAGNVPALMSKVAEGVDKITTSVVYATGVVMGQKWAKLVGSMGGTAADARALAWARTQDGKRYQWGGDGNPSWDCSGFMSAIESVIRGQRPHRRWATGSFRGHSGPSGWKWHLNAPFKIGVINGGPGGGHTAGTLLGHNVESSGSHGVQVDGPARGYRDPYFRGQWWGFVPSIGTGAGASGKYRGNPKAYARSLFPQWGWSVPWNWPSLNALWEHESGWRWWIKNPSSGAYGIPQALPASKMRSAGPDWRTNPATQIQWGLGYINTRYGNPHKAWRFWQGHNWYDTGGDLRPGLTYAQNAMKGPTRKSRTESVITDDWRRTVEDKLRQIDEKIGSEGGGSLVGSYTQNFYGAGDTREAMQALLFTLRRARQEVSVP